jgi:hypothetical protein
LAQPNADSSFRFAIAAQDERVAILEERALLAVAQGQRLLAALRELEQRAGLIGRRTG